MASSSSTIPVRPPLQPDTGEGLETPSVVPAASTEAMVDAPVAPPPVPGESTPAAPSFVSGEAKDLREGSVDFSFPMEDWDWTVSGLEPTVDQAWVPNLDEVSELLIQKGDLQAAPINFDFLCAASKDWSHWVDREILDSDFWDSLVDAGIHWSILISRSCNMFRDTESLRELLRRWCPSTHTFLFSWGELTPILEDVANHWMLPILGEHSFSNIKLSAEEEEIAAALRKQSSTRLSGWLSHFTQLKGAPIRRAAFVLYWLCKCTFCYLFAAREKSAAWGRFSDLPREFLDRFPDFRDNLPLVYRWVGLKTRDCDLVDTLDYEENVLFRPYGDDYPSLSYLSTVNLGFLPILSATGVSFIPYCPQRVQRQFGLDQGIPVGPQETATCVADLTAFLKSRAFARWGGETTRVLISGGHRLGLNTPSMGAYWQRFTQSMVEFVIAGRSDKTPISLDSLNWDGVRGGLIAYTIHLPEGWRDSVNVVEDRLIMPSKRGKGSKREAPVDQAIEKTSKKPTPSVPSSKKAPSKKTKAGKKGKSPLLVPSTARESTTALVEEPIESAVVPPKKKTKAGKESSPSVAPSKKTKARKEGKSTPLVPSAAKESTTAPVEEPTESTVAPSKLKSVSASPPKKSGKKSVALRPSKGQKKTSVSSSSPDEEQPSPVSTPLPSKKKKFVAPLFPLGAAGHTRSKSGSKVTHGSGRSGGGVVDVEDSDAADDDVIANPLREDAPQTAAVDQDEDLRKSAADSSEVGAESTGDDHSFSSDSFFDSIPGSVPEEQIMSAGSTADDDDMPGADDSSMGPADPMEVPQTVLTSTGSDASMAYIMGGISLFGATPSLRAIPSGGFVISASRIAGETPSVVGGALIPEETHAQGLIESESVVDLGVNTADHDAPIEDAGVSAADTLAGSDHLENIGMDDTVHMSEDASEVGITGEITAVSPPPRPTVEAGSSVGVGSLSNEVADFLKEFDKKVPNPHPEHDFTADFKLNTSLSGPMLSLLGSVLAAMDESSLEDRLRQTAQYFFGKRIADEIKALQHQIVLLQDSLVELTAYQDVMVSTGRMVLRSDRGGSFLDSLLDLTFVVFRVYLFVVTIF
uniref:Aminotransferase-like plant mobile domain-containing protein n=1 Tax=Fagus sylvatica TaxID=28930 RepID=A0A2N9H550_FAGSY